MAPEPPLEPDVVLRRSLRRACDRGAGLDVIASSAKYAELAFDDSLAKVQPNDLIIGLMRDGALVGALAVSCDFKAALVEAQTIGVISKSPAEERPASGTDAALVSPALAVFLDEVCPLAGGTAIDGWLDDIRLGQRLMSTRVLELSLVNETLGVIELDCGLGPTDRTGQLRLLVPMPGADAPDMPTAVAEDWITLWRPVAQSVPTRLEAVLHRAVMGWSTLSAFRVGDVLPLPGASVAGVRLSDSSGAIVARGRLGQVGGYRAIRVEPREDPTLQMDDLAGGPAMIDAMPGGDMMGEDPAVDMGGFPDMDLPDAGGDGMSMDLDAPMDPDMPMDLDMSGESDVSMDLDLPGGMDLPMGGDVPLDADEASVEFDMDLPDMTGDAAEDLPGIGLPDLDLPEVGGGAPADDPIALDLDMDMGGDAPEIDLDLDFSID